MISGFRLFFELCERLFFREKYKSTWSIHNPSSEKRKNEINFHENQNVRGPILMRIACHDDWKSLFISIHPSAFFRRCTGQKKCIVKRAGMTPFTAPRCYGRVYKEAKHLTKKHKYQPICILTASSPVSVWQREIMFTIKVGTLSTVVRHTRAIQWPARISHGILSCRTLEPPPRLGRELLIGVNRQRDSFDNSMEKNRRTFAISRCAFLFYFDILIFNDYGYGKRYVEILLESDGWFDW